MIPLFLFLTSCGGTAQDGYIAQQAQREITKCEQAGKYGQVAYNGPELIVLCTLVPPCR